MTVNTIMAIYTMGFAMWMLEKMITFLQTGNMFMAIIAAVALYGPIETITKYYYVRKAVMEEIEAKGGDNVDRK